MLAIPAQIPACTANAQGCCLNWAGTRLRSPLRGEPLHRPTRTNTIRSGCVQYSDCEPLNREVVMRRLVGIALVGTVAALVLSATV